MATHLDRGGSHSVSDAVGTRDGRVLALAVIVLSQFMVVLDTAIVNVAASVGFYCSGDTWLTCSEAGAFSRPAYFFSQSAR
jgi:hypothetical protein